MNFFMLTRTDNGFMFWLATSTQKYAETAGALNAAKLFSSFVINNASVITSKDTDPMIMSRLL
jgi:hypothetical protein